MQGRNEGKRKGKEGRGGKGKSEQKRRATVMMRVREMRCSMQAQTWERPRKLAKEERAGWFSKGRGAFADIPWALGRGGAQRCVMLVHRCYRPYVVTHWVLLLAAAGGSWPVRWCFLGQAGSAGARARKRSTRRFPKAVSVGKRPSLSKLPSGCGEK